MKKLTFALAFVLAFTVLNGCATAPEGIPATFVSGNAYADMSCDEVASELRTAKAELTSLSRKQANSRTRGIIYNLFLVPGAGAMTKDRADEIGMAKGHVAAMQEHLLGACRAK